MAIISTDCHALLVSLLSDKSMGRNTPRSVIMPVIKQAGVTSNAGFQQDIPVT